MTDSGEPQMPSWSGPRPFVGRAVVLEALTREVYGVMAGDGRAVFLLGPAASAARLSKSGGRRGSAASISRPSKKKVDRLPGYSHLEKTRRIPRIEGTAPARNRPFVCLAKVW